MDDGYLDHGIQRFESFKSRKRRPSLKLTAKSNALLLQPNTAIVKIRAIRHCVFSSSAMETDDDHDMASEETEDNHDAPTYAMSVNRKGFLIVPQAMQTILQDSSHEATLRIAAMFSVTSVSSSQMDCDDGNTNEPEVMNAASRFCQLTSLPPAKTNIFKKKESSHQNIDIDLQRTCKANTCKTNCRSFVRIFSHEIAKQRLKRLRKVSILIFSFT